MAGIKCEIINEIGKVGKLEVNVVDWNDKGPKIDVREWYTNDEGETRPGRGINLKVEQVDTLIELLKQAKEAM